MGIVLKQILEMNMDVAAFLPHIYSLLENSSTPVRGAFDYRLSAVCYNFISKVVKDSPRFCLV